MNVPRSGAIRAVLFDLDGTLLDTAPDLVAALNHVRSVEGLAPVELREFRRYVSRGAIGLLRAGMPEEGDERLEQRRRRFLEHYARHSVEQTRPFDGIEPLLEALERRGLPWGVVTNKPEYLTHPIIEEVGWARRAACVICGDTTVRSKPDPAPVRLACELAGVATDEAVLVGDDPRDIEAGEAAGTHVALAAYGYGAQEVLASGRPLEFVVERPQEVLTLPGLGSPHGANLL